MVFNPSNGVLFFADPGNGKIRGWDINNQLLPPYQGNVFTAVSLPGVNGLGFAGTGFNSGVLATTANGIYLLQGLGGSGTVTPQLILAAQGASCLGSTDGFINVAGGGAPVNYGLQYNANWPGTPPGLSAALQTAMNATLADSEAAQQPANFISPGTVCNPLGVTFLSGNAGAFPGGTYVFTESGKLRGYL
ncbi:MAG: hypothetical protein JOZ38_07735 [Candidatus Eremiobacteraeota bacterium]|nr:hypothetical protein [Candidatus Eremiobacteraeota bacterium]